MYDQDYEDWVQEQVDAEVGKQVREGKYETKDSGKRFEAEDGMVRDTSEGKPQFTLLFPKDVPYEDQLMTRVADLYHRGGVKYGPRNWEKSSTEESLAKHEDCLMRHVIKFLLGVEDGEDHAAAVVWNVNAVDLTRRKIREGTPAKLEGLETRPHNHNPFDFKAGSYSGPDCGCGCGKNLPGITDDLNTTGVKEVLPEYAPDQSLIGYIPGERKAKPFPTVEFSVGDTLKDKNYYTWKLTENYNWLQDGPAAPYERIGDLAFSYGPLAIQTGAYAGITVLKDGSLRWG
jgi:hypothetical protein